MLHIAVCEDKAEDVEHLRRMLPDTGMSCDITEYGRAETLIDDIENGRKRFDIFFLDIYLPSMSGVEAARFIRAKDENAILIFLSTSEDFYREAFDLYAFHYLIKPITKDELQSVLQKASEVIGRQADETLMIYVRSQDIKLRYADIEYISSSNHTLCVHLHSGQEYSFYGKLDDMEKRLKSNLFVRCHKSFIVNLSYVSKMASDGFYIGDTLISISRSYAASAKKAYHRQLFEIFGEH